MSVSTLREQAGTSTRDPSTSTTQARQTLTGVSVSSWQSVGVSMPSRRHASRIVEPSRASKSWPSTLTLTSFLGRPTNTGSAIQHLQLGQPRGDRVGRRLTQPADRCVAHGLRDIAQQHDVGVAVTAVPGEGALEDLLLALGPDSARHALTARLVTEETRDAQPDLL